MLWRVHLHHRRRHGSYPREELHGKHRRYDLNVCVLTVTTPGTTALLVGTEALGDALFVVRLRRRPHGLHMLVDVLAELPTLLPQFEGLSVTLICGYAMPRKIRCRASRLTLHKLTAFACHHHHRAHLRLLHSQCFAHSRHIHLEACRSYGHDARLLDRRPHPFSPPIVSIARMVPRTPPSVVLYSSVAWSDHLVDRCPFGVAFLCPRRLVGCVFVPLLQSHLESM